MNDDSYFVCTSGESGIRIAGPMTKAHVQARLTEMIDGVDPKYHPTLLDKVPESDRGYWIVGFERPVLIIKGRIVVPKPIEVVKQFEF